MLKRIQKIFSLSLFRIKSSAPLALKRILYYL